MGVVPGPGDISCAENAVESSRSDWFIRKVHTSDGTTVSESHDSHLRASEVTVHAHRAEGDFCRCHELEALCRDGL